MPRNNKRSGVLANARTVKARKQVVEDNYYKKVRKWDSALEDWEVKCQSLYNPKGHSRTYEETALMLLLLKAKLQALVDDRSYYDISWTKLEEMVAMDLKVVPTLNELQLGFAAYLRDNNPQALECLVERCLKDEGYDVLWTPPYTPDLQPIETYWAIGKNRVAENYYNGRSMKTTVEQLREAWYGNETMANKALCRIVQPANCSGITQKAISIANKRFIPLCPDLRGELGSLEATNTVGSSADFPIDLVVADYGAITIEDTEDTEDTVVDTVVDVDID